MRRNGNVAKRLQGFGGWLCAAALAAIPSGGCIVDRQLDHTLLCEDGDCDCAPGLFDCDNDMSNGCEIDLLSDRNNCGVCGNGCIQLDCIAGECDCQLPFANCDDIRSNGCETYLSTDPDHCGECNRRCTERLCTEGVCGCLYPRADCDQFPGNGCETDLGGSSSHCGECDHACQWPTTCLQGICH